MDRNTLTSNHIVMIKKNVVLLAQLLLPVLVNAQVPLGNTIDGIQNNSEFGEAVACSRDGARVAVGAPSRSANFPGNGSVLVFELLDTSWTQVGQELQGTATQQYFGTSVALNADGTILAVGAVETSPWNGRVFLFQYDGASWSQMGSTLVDNGGVQFGWKVALDSLGHTVIVGANKDYAKVFSWNMGTLEWDAKGVILGDLNNPGGEDGTGQGVDITADGDRVVVGSPDYDVGSPFDNRGRARVFDWDGTQWVQVGSSLSGSPGNVLGKSVSINAAGTQIAVGAPQFGGSNIGYVRSYIWDPGLTNWLAVDTIIGDSDDRLGTAVSLNASGDVLAVGAEESSSSEPGRVKRFVLNGNDWVLSGVDILGAAPSNSGTGKSGSLELDGCGKRLFVGSTDLANTNPQVGVVRAFTYCDTTFAQSDTTSCGPVTLGDSTHTTSGIHVQIDQDGCGCITELTTTLEIQVLDTTVVQAGLVLTAAAIDSATYQWIDCLTGQPVDSATEQMFVPAVDGNYAVQLTVDSCMETSACHVVVGTGINEVSTGSNSLFLWPNPAHSSFQLRVDEPATILVRDAFGRMVHQTRVAQGATLLHPGLAPGIYSVEAVSLVARRTTRLIIAP